MGRTYTEETGIKNKDCFLKMTSGKTSLKMGKGGAVLLEM